MVGASFSRVRPSRNRSGERLRTATARKNVKNRLRRRLRTHFFVPGPVFGRFWGPGRVPKSTQNRPKSLLLRRFLEPGSRLFAFSSFRRVPEGSRTDSGGSGDPPGPDFDRFCRDFLIVTPGSCRGLSGSAGILPGSASRRSNPFAVFPRGTAIRAAI